MHYIFLEKAFSRDSDKIFYQYLSLRWKGQFTKYMLSIRSKHQQNMRIFLATFWLNHSVLCHSVLWERELIYFILALVFLFCNHVLPLKLCRKKCRNYNIIFFLKYWHRYSTHPVSFYRTKWMPALSEQWSRLMQALDHCRVTLCLHWMIARNHAGIGRLRRVAQCRHLSRLIQALDD